MACPSGCLNGGGQVKPPDSMKARDLALQVGEVFHADLKAQDPSDNEKIKRIYR